MTLGKRSDTGMGFRQVVVVAAECGGVKVACSGNSIRGFA